MSVMLLEPGLTELLVQPFGPVGRYVTVKAEAVAEIARQNVRATFVSRTGNLEQSIGVFPDETVDGLECEVGTDGAPYGRILEEGSTAHEIRANTSAYLWSLNQDPNHPDPLYTKGLRRVAHPGNPPKPWLRPALETVFTGG